MIISGIPYVKAQEMARRCGIEIHRVEITAPPRATVGIGRLRVVRQLLVEGKLHLVLAYEDYK